MRHVYPSEIESELAFARRAAAEFASDKRLVSFADGDIEPGALLALRWGMGDDCVLVLKLDEIHTPTIYAQIVRAAANAPTSSQPAQEGNPS